MKIAFINTYCNGSTGTIANNIASFCETNGVETRCFYGRIKSETKWIYIGSNKLVTLLNNLLVYFTGNVGGFHKKNTKRLIDELKKFSPDVISIHNIHGNYLNFKLLFKYLSSYQGKIFFTLHDAFLLGGRCCHPNVQCKQAFICKKCKYLKDYPHVFIDKSRQLLAAKKTYIEKLKDPIFISPSNYLDSLISNSHLKNYTHFVINNGIKLSDFSPVRNKSGDERIKLLFVASPWSDSKGAKIICELLNLLDKKKYEFTIVGDIKKSRLKNHKKELNCLGKLPKKELDKLYQNADIFINPTLQDNFPTVLIESLSNGLPVITFNTGGCKEIIDGSCGVVLKTKTAKELASSIKNFNFGLFSREKCIKRSKCFSLKQMVEGYYERFIK